MTVEILNSAINGIDENIVEQALEVNSRNKSRYKYISVAAVAAVLVIGAITGAFLKKLPLNGGDKSGGLTGESVQAQSEITLSGTGFAEEEILALISKNKEYLLETVCLEYSLTNEEVAVSSKGYSHVVCGSKNSINLNAITLPVTVNGKIMANIELVKSKEETVFTLNIGGEKWDKYNDALLKYPDRQVVFVFAGNGAAEVIVLPDNSIVAVTQSSAELCSKKENWYSILKTEYNTLSFNELQKNLIVLNGKTQITAAAQTKENATIAESNSNYYSVAKMHLSTQLGEAMGKAGKELNAQQTAQVTQLLGPLNLQSREEPEASQFPTGGGIVIRNGKDKYIFYSNEIIDLNGSYYMADNKAYDNLIVLLTKMLQ